MNEQETKPNESTLLAVGGAGFLILAGFFLWRDLALPPAAMLIAAAAGGVAPRRRCSGRGAGPRWRRRRCWSYRRGEGCGTRR